jgi:bifunctional UDP-N-acetylglucosamine pyrophosphorylase/glucosamine-1-phosphate N-acetyltransferase
VNPFSKDIIIVILAAGKSSRMGLKTSKVLFPVAGRPMVCGVLDIAHKYAKNAVYVVVSPEVDQALAAENVHTIVQKNPRGTGHAFALALDEIMAKDPEMASKKIIVLLGDMPLLAPSDLSALLENSQDAPLSVMGMRPPCADGYGRLCVQNDRLMRIVESKDATDAEKAIDLCHTGIMCMDGDFAQKAIPQLVPSPITGELYLTDLVRLAPHATYCQGPWEHFMGVNTRQELMQAERAMQERLRGKAFDQGAYLISPETTFLSYDTVFSPGVVVHPMVCFGPGVVLESDVTIYSGSVLEHCCIQHDASIGPFARIRAGTVLGPFGQIGNFVETKNATFGQYSQAKHLSYIGDAAIGDHVNIGAGVITCNYDGHSKKMTRLDDGVFVGSQTTFIAPIHVGKNATIGAGSIITKSVEPETLALSRVEQKSIPLRAHSKHLNRIKKGASETPVGNLGE